MPPKGSEFQKAKDQSQAQYIHTCDPGIKPYAKVTIVEWGRQTVTCPHCGHGETWVFNDQGRWTIA